MDPIPATWPRTGQIEVPWRPTVPDDLVPRAVRARHRAPYRAALVPTIASATAHLRAETTAIADDATRAITRFDAEVGHELTGLDAVLLRSESASSSQVEHLTARARAIALAEIGGEGNPATSNAGLIAANAAAVRLALDRAASLDEASVLAVHDALLRGHAPSIAGRWRTEAVWIGGSSYGPHEATFVPPRHEDVPAAMADLMAFARRTDLPVLVHAAIAHAHVETIHPFPDGNGRTGRALLQAMLRGGGADPEQHPAGLGRAADRSRRLRRRAGGLPRRRRGRDRPDRRPGRAGGHRQQPPPRGGPACGASAVGGGRPRPP